MTHQNIALTNGKFNSRKKEKHENRYTPKLEADTDNYTAEMQE